MKYIPGNTDEEYEMQLKRECLRLAKQQGENISFYHREERSAYLEPVTEEQYLNDRRCHMRIDNCPFWIIQTKDREITGIKKMQPVKPCMKGASL